MLVSYDNIRKILVLEDERNCEIGVFTFNADKGLDDFQTFQSFEFVWDYIITIIKQFGLTLDDVKIYDNSKFFQAFYSGETN